MRYGSAVTRGMTAVGMLALAWVFVGAARQPTTASVDARHPDAARIDRPIDWSVPAARYNCAGLAFRTYRYMSLEETKAVLGRCRRLASADEPCPAGWVRVCAWWFTVRREAEGGETEPAEFDGHLVAGRSDDGGGPAVVFSKFGRGPVTGPAAPGTWKPVAREYIGRTRDGRRVYYVRENIVERWYCAPAESLAENAV